MQNNSDSVLPFPIYKSPMLLNVVLNNMAEYMDWESLKMGREVCSIWKEAFTPKFRMCSQVKADFSLKGLSTAFISKFPSTLTLNGLYLILNPEEDFMYPVVRNWFRSYGSQVTRLTIANSSKKDSQHLNVYCLCRIFEDYCPNIKYLTLVNLKLSNYSYNGDIFKELVPTIYLNELKIMSTKLVDDEGPEFCKYIIPFGIAEHFLNIYTINIEFNAKDGELYISDEGDTWGYQQLQNVVHLSFENKAQENGYSKYILYLCYNVIFPNLKSLRIQKGMYIVDFVRSGDRDNMCFMQFPKLELLALPNLIQFRNFVLRFPVLKELQLSDLNNLTPSLTTFDIFAHPNVQYLKVNLRNINFETVFGCFPKLQSLEVDLRERNNLNEELAILSRHSTLKELIIIDNKTVADFESAIELHFGKLLIGLQKLSIKTLNTVENPDSNLLNIFAQHVSKANSAVKLTSVTLQGFKICSQQYDLMKHQLPFHLRF